MRTASGLALGVISGALFALSYYGQHHALRGTRQLSFCRPLGSLRNLLANRRWLVATSSSWVGWIVYVAALDLAPLSLVQALNAGMAGLLLVALQFRTATSTTRFVALVALVGFVIVVATVRDQHGTETPHTGAISILALFAAGFCSVALLSARSAAHRGAVLGITSGVSYGVGDVAMKGALSGGWALLALSLTASAAGFCLLQLSYQRANLMESGGLSCLLTNALPIVAGVLLFGEVPASGVDLALRCTGFALIVVGVVPLVALQSGSEQVERGTT